MERFANGCWQMPFELSLKILPLLSVKDIEQCRLTCKQWRLDLDSMVEKPLSWLTASPVLHDVALHSHNIVPLKRKKGLYAMHPIVSVGNDFFIFERKANERHPTALHVVHKRDYEGSVRLTKQTVWLIPFDVLSVEQAFAVYSKLGIKNHTGFLPEERTKSIFITVDIFERKTFEPLPMHAALTNVVAVCQKDNIIYHVCLFQENNSTSDKRFTLFALRSLRWQELASTLVRTCYKIDWKEEHTSLCALNFITCHPYVQVENTHVLWTCGAHCNRAFLADVTTGTVTTIVLNGGSHYSAETRTSLSPPQSPAVLFGGNVLCLGVKSRMRLDWEWETLKLDLINISTDKILEELPECRNLHQTCSGQFLVFIMEVANDFFLLCMESNSCSTRRAKFPYYPYGYYNDIKMVISEPQEQLFIHILSNELNTSLRCSNHVFVFDLTQEDLNSGMHVFNLGLSHYPPAISFTSGLIMQDVSFVRENRKTQWSEAIRMYSINASGFVQLTEKHRGLTDCGPECHPEYFSNCKEGMWKRRMSYQESHSCKWCTYDPNFHHDERISSFSIRMDPSIFLLDFELSRRFKNKNGDYIGDEAIRETRARLIGRKKGKCKGFWPKLWSQPSRTYLICNEDGKTCFHARWKKDSR